MAKSKPKLAAYFTKQSPLVRGLVVLVVIGLGAGLLPLLHAATPAPPKASRQWSAPSVTPSPSKIGSTISVKISWKQGKKQRSDASTPKQWKVSESGDSSSGTVYKSYATSSYTFTQLACGWSYKFSVTALNSSQNPISDIGTTTVACPTVSFTKFAPSSATSVGFNWTASSFIIASSAFLRTDGGSYVATQLSDSARSLTKTVECGHSYSAYIVVGTTYYAPSSKTLSTTTTCPKPSLNKFSISGTKASVTWGVSTSASNFKVALLHSNTHSTKLYSVSKGGTSGSFSGTVLCGQTYVASVFADFPGGGSSVSAFSNSLKAPACGTKNTTTTVSTGSGHSGGGNSGGGTTDNGISSTSKPANSTPPGAPTDFTATVQSAKVVELSWDAIADADHYVVQSSTDNATWTTIAGTDPLNNYTDGSANFDTTYYYRVQTVNADGKKSGWATAQVTTGSFSGTGNTFSSSDKVVKITAPSGAFSQTVNCTVNSDTDSLTNVPKGEAALIGPYDLICVGADGSVVNSFNQPLQVTMNLSSVVSGYNNITAKTTNGTTWTGLKTTYNAKTQQLSFQLASAESFAAFGKVHKSSGGAIIGVILLILLALAAFFGLRWYRGRDTSPSLTSGQQSEAFLESVTGGAAVAAGTVASVPAAAMATPATTCTHLDQAQQVTPQSQGCQECLAAGTQWKALRICLICGHVGCSDDSPEQHALKHFQSTGHPLVYDFNDPSGAQAGWCYIDNVQI